MTTQTIRIELPDEIYRRLQEMAAATKRPLADVLVQTIRGNLPLMPDDLPPAQHDLVADLAPLEDDTLWAIARESLPAAGWRRHRHLLRKAESGTMTPAD